MTATADHAPTAPGGDPGSAEGVAVEVRADSGISRLQPADGLFLRAEHLARMQDYARDLTSALGVATGSGVVHGFRATLDGDHLVVGAGLAVGPPGRCLRTRLDTVIPLHDLVIEAKRFWVLEVAPGPGRPYGEENVYGSVCEDPCDPGSRLRPWLDEGVVLRLVADTADVLADEERAARRSKLASFWFERERRRADPWLTPVAPDTPVPPLVDRPWAAGTPEPSGAGVPLAVLLREDDRWLLDVWTARRDLGDPHPVRAWQARLAGRPRDVFVAQVLQFNAQLADVLGDGGSAAAPCPDPIEYKEVADLLAALKKFEVGLRKEVKEAAAALRDAPRTTVSVDVTSLRGMGFRELPPAGFVPAAPQGVEDVAGYYARLFFPLDVTVCRAAADVVPGIVDLARHLDRIPLDPVQPPPQVRVVVPEVAAADLPAVRAEAYGWAAFVRWRDIDCGDRQTVLDEHDEVDVYRVELGVDPGALKVEVMTTGRAGALLGTLRYPAGRIEPDPAVDLDPMKPDVDTTIDSAIAVSRADGNDRTVERAKVLVERLVPGAAAAVSPVVTEHASRDAIVLVPRSIAN